MSTNYIAIDCETTGLDFLKDKILCVGFSDGTYFTLTSQIEEVKNKIRQLKLAGNTIVGQNLSFDCKFLWANGIALENTFDTMVAAYLLTDSPGKLGLDSLASYYLGLPSWKDDIKSGAVFEDPELMKMYCLQDCEVTAKLAPLLEEKLRAEGKWEFFGRLMAARRMLTRAEYRGVRFDVDAARALIGAKMAEYEAQMALLHAQGGQGPKFNWNSPKQILGLMKGLGLNTINPLTKKESADVTVLELNEHKHPLIKSIMQMRKTKKLITSLEGYIEVVRADGALHPNFNCTNTRTGRLSSSGDLNFQQADRSKPVRSLFTARPGMKLIVGDLAQIEVRLAAHYSKDKLLMAMFEREEDFYGTLAVQLLGADCAPNDVKRLYPDKRAVAKVIGLSVLYGIGTNKLRNTIEQKGGVTGFTLEQARKVITDYFDKFFGLKELQKAVHRAVTAKGHLVNLVGRKVDVSEDKVFMEGVNSLLQSSASDFLLFKITDFEPRLNELGAHVLALVHDEVIVEAPEAVADQVAQELSAFICYAPNIKVPMKFPCAVGDNWGVKE